MVEHTNDMKLERYTLTYFRGHKEIVELPKQFRRMFLEDLTVGKVILKTDSNVYKLVEVGDLVKYHHSNKVSMVLQVERIFEADGNLEFGLDIPYAAGTRTTFWVKPEQVSIIYKVQPNGSYDAYEVNRKEGK